MSTAERIIHEIARQGMVRADREREGVMVWAGNAAEQLGAVLGRSSELEALRLAESVLRAYADGLPVEKKQLLVALWAVHGVLSKYPEN